MESGSVLQLGTASIVLSNIISELRTSAVSIQIISLCLAVPADPVVEVVSAGSSIAGTTFILTCTVTLPHPLSKAPRIEWVGLDGTEIRNGTIADMIIISLSPHTKALTFDPLHTDYGGEYQCKGSVDIPEAEVFISDNTIFNITVQS